MTLHNKNTEETISIPPPDELGNGVVMFNGRVVEHVHYCDKGEAAVTLGSGISFPNGHRFALYLTNKLHIGAYRESRTK